MNIREKGQAMLEGVARMRAKYQEGEKLLRQLEVCALAMAQGVDPCQVTTFGYDPNLDKRPEYRRWRAWRAATSRPPRVYNYVNLKAGGRLELAEPIPVPYLGDKL